MKLRQIFEGLGQEVAIIFGRFNPPHKGHRAAWELASKSPVWYVGTNESTVGPKDPLPYGIKVEAMTAIWPEVEGHIIAETSWLTLASLVYEKHGDVTLLCLTDEDWVTKTIVQYNGKEGAHGFYNFKTIKQKPTPRLSSATALRDAVTKGDREAFATAAGLPADTPVAGKPFFDLVAEYLLPYSDAPIKKPAKKKVAAPVEGMTEATLGNALSWPEVANKISSAMKAMGWKVQRKGDDAFMFSTKGAEDESQYYMVMIDNEGDGMFTYALGTFEGGRPDIGEQDTLPTTEASVSEVLMAIRDGYGLGEDASLSELDIKKKTLTTQKMPNDIIMLVHKLKKNVPLRPDEYQKLLAYKAFRKESMQTPEGAGEGTKPTMPAGTVRVDVSDVYDWYKLGKNISNLKKAKKSNFGKGPPSTIVSFGSEEEEHKYLKDLKKLGLSTTDIDPKDPKQPKGMKRQKVDPTYNVGEDAAGVGIITKQNSTVDVNKGTPRKNLKAFRLVK